MIEELERLEKAATPGPWGVNPHIGRDIVMADQGIVADLDEDTPRARADAALIAALRNAAPALIEAARVLRDWEQTLIDLDYDGSAWLEMLDRTRDALAALKRPEPNT